MTGSSARLMALLAQVPLIVGAWRHDVASILVALTLVLVALVLAVLSLGERR